MKINRGSKTETLVITNATIGSVITRADLLKDTATIETSGDFAALITQLNKTPRPFAVAIIRPK